jgi:phosphatidylglycerol---prolipoprotein diacylglyceryl transferase
MKRELIHIYGPLAINSFGLFIIIGLVISSVLLLSDPKRSKLISIDDYFNALSLAIVTALIGGRSLFVITHWKTIEHWWNIFEFWVGGFSLLGTVVALLSIMPLYLKKRKINIIGLLDLVAIYAPLVQSISRIGCFFAGCCFGLPTSLPFGVINSECGIPEFANKTLHPTQLYSAFALLGIFLLHYFVLQYYFKKPGQLFISYLFLMSIERFTVDFWRANRELITISRLEFLSIPQVIALIIATAALVAFRIITLHKPK